jgi:hypothetical protein
MEHEEYEETHWVNFKMIHWDISKDKLPKVFDYIHRVQIALTNIKVAYKFDVRCRLVIVDEKDVEIFSSLLEVEFVVHEHELSEQLLVDYIKESTDLYLDEFDIRKENTILKNLNPGWAKIPDWNRAAQQSIEKLKS